MIPRGLRAVPYNVREHRGRGRACASGRRRQAGLAGLRAKISSPLPARSARGGQALTEGVLRVCGEEMYIYDTMDLSGSMRARIPDASTRSTTLDIGIKELLAKSVDSPKYCLLWCSRNCRSVVISLVRCLAIAFRLFQLRMMPLILAVVALLSSSQMTRYSASVMQTLFLKALQNFT